MNTARKDPWEGKKIKLKAPAKVAKPVIKSKTLPKHVGITNQYGYSSSKMQIKRK
jgi:hypothetical protein